MTTLARQPVKKTPPRKSVPKRAPHKASLGARLKQRAGYWLRHPLNAAWGWFSSVRTAILLISAITAICALGIYFVQAPGEVLNDPTAYATWVQINALPKYGSLTPIFDWLQFYTIFSSWYFMLLLILLATSILIGGMLQRLPAIWQNFRHPVLRRSDKFYENALERGSFEHDDAVAWTTQTLHARGFRVRSVVEALETDEKRAELQETSYLYANKNSWATLSTFVFHLALITLLLAGVCSQWHGFPPDSPARHILPAPFISLTDDLAGFTFDQALPQGTSALVYPRGTPHNISFRTNKFTATFDPRTGLPTDYVTDLSVFRDGVLVAHSNHLRVNDPLTYDGVVFHQSSLIPSVNVTLSDANGCLVCNQPIVLSQTEHAPGNLQVDLNSVPIAGTGLLLNVFFVHNSGSQMAQIAQPLILLTIGDPDASSVQKDDAVSLHSGKSATIHQNWKATLNDASEATVLLVTRDTGSTLIWPTAAILILSLCATFYFPQRRIWLKIIGTRVQMAALREHFVNIRTDLLALEKAGRGEKKQT